jgi:hypothetical protein
MTKRIVKLMLTLLILSLLSVAAYAQCYDSYGFEEPKDLTTQIEKVQNFIAAVQAGDTRAFRLITADVLIGRPLANARGAEGEMIQIKTEENDVYFYSEQHGVAYGMIYQYINTDVGGTTGYEVYDWNVIDTIIANAFINEVSFMEYLCDGDTSPESETRKKVITATLQGLYNLDPRIRLVAINWLRRLRPDAIMFRDVERAVEYETVASSFEKYRPKNIDIPSIDQPGAEGVNIPFDYNTWDEYGDGSDADSDQLYSTYEEKIYDQISTEGDDAVFYDNTEEFGGVDYNPEEEIYYPFDNPDGTTPEEKINIADETGYVAPLTGPHPTATQLDARKWGNGNAFDPLKKKDELRRYIDVMTTAGALRRFRNLPDTYLVGYQYRLGYYGVTGTRPIDEEIEAAFNDPYNDVDFRNLTDADYAEIISSMVPIGHGDKYFYRNMYGKKVIGNTWAELIKLREYIVRAIWYQKN